LLGAALLATSLVACTRADDEGLPVVVVIQDGTAPDAREVISPAILGFELGLEGSGLMTRIVDVGDLDPEALARDPDVVAVMVAPFTGLGRAAAARLASAGLPIASLSEIGPRHREGSTLRRFVPSLEVHARSLAGLGRGGSPCVAGDGSAWSDALAAAVAARTTLVGAPAGVVRAAADAGCTTLIWTGAGDGATEVAALLSARAPRIRLVLAARARTASVAETLGSPADAVCPCADLSTSSAPSAQRFLHELQAATGLDPGPYAVEGYDAGRLIGRSATGGRTRREVAASLAEVEHLGGVVARYRWRPTGDLIRPSVRMYERVGLRWLERPSGLVAHRVPRA